MSSVWTPDSDIDIKLTNSGATYTLTDSDDSVETYTVASGLGTLNSIAYPNGYTQTMNYTSGVLTSVSDSYSRSLTFTYTSGMLTGVTTPDSATLTYGYTTTAGPEPADLGLLQHQPDNQPDLCLRDHHAALSADQHHRRERQHLRFVHL